MVKYSYLTIAVSVCRDFDEDRHIDIIDFDNPLKTLYNLMDEQGRVVVDIRTILGRDHIDNYCEPILGDGKIRYRSCIVVKRFYLKLPRPMTKEEASKFLETITGVKLPVKPYSREEQEFIIKLYKQLKNLEQVIP